MKTPEPETLYSMTDTAKALGINYERLRQAVLIHRPVVPMMLGKHRFFTEEQIEAMRQHFLNRNPKTGRLYK